MSTTVRFGLTLLRGPFVEPDRRRAHARLMRDVFEIEMDPAESRPRPWIPFGLFDSDGRCIGCVEAAILPLMLDGKQAVTGGIRSVAIDPDWRGRGLFRDLMTDVLAWCEARGAVSTFLYTEDPALYARFGFGLLPQHAFVGPSVAAPPSGQKTRRLDLSRREDRAIVRALVGRRAPVSRQCALAVDATLFMGNLAKDSALHVAHAAWIDTLVVYEMTDDELTLADVVAPRMPDLSTIIGALTLRPDRVKTLFPPDQIGWQGEPIGEETGLMIRGAVPAAMSRPFMFAPTAEF